MRMYDEDGNAVYCRGSGTLAPGKSQWDRVVCPECGFDVLLTMRQRLRKHFPKVAAAAGEERADG